MALKKWNKEEEELLSELYPISSKEDLIKAIPGKTFGAIRTRAAKLKLLKAVGFGKKKTWKQSELHILKKLYSETPNSELLEKFDCSSKSLYSAANKLGLKKTSEYMSKTFGPILKRVGESTRYSKGSIPANKGKKWNEFMSLESQENARKTTFKKGNKPHNTVEVGFERITKDGYIEVKVGDFDDSTLNFRLKHRLVWEQYFGEVPANHQVRFIDENKRNFAIENLKLVSLADSLRMNSMCDDSVIKRFLGIKNPEIIEKIKKENPSLIQLKRNEIKLNQKIKNNGTTAN
jgi:hypothetical protein